MARSNTANAKMKTAKPEKNAKIAKKMQRKSKQIHAHIRMRAMARNMSRNFKYVFHILYCDDTHSCWVQVQLKRFAQIIWGKQHTFRHGAAAAAFACSRWAESHPAWWWLRFVGLCLSSQNDNDNVYCPNAFFSSSADYSPVISI